MHHLHVDLQQRRQPAAGLVLHLERSERGSSYIMQILLQAHRAKAQSPAIAQTLHFNAIA
jgi:hypothetical protein